MFDLVKDYLVDVWELRKARLYDKNLNIPQVPVSEFIWGTGNSGRLRCLHGKVETTISRTYIVGSAQCSGCVVYGPSAMAAI